MMVQSNGEGDFSPCIGSILLFFYLFRYPYSDFSRKFRELHIFTLQAAKYLSAGLQEQANSFSEHNGQSFVQN